MHRSSWLFTDSKSVQDLTVSVGVLSLPSVLTHAVLANSFTSMRFEGTSCMAFWNLLDGILISLDASRAAVIAGTLPAHGLFREPLLVHSAWRSRKSRQAVSSRPPLLLLACLQCRCELSVHPVLLLRALLLYLGWPLPCSTGFEVYHCSSHSCWLHHVLQICGQAFCWCEDSCEGCYIRNWWQEWGQACDLSLKSFRFVLLNSLHFLFRPYTLASMV